MNSEFSSRRGFLATVAFLGGLAGFTGTLLAQKRRASAPQKRTPSVPEKRTAEEEAIRLGSIMMYRYYDLTTYQAVILASSVGRGRPSRPPSRIGRMWMATGNEPDQHVDIARHHVALDFESPVVNVRLSNNAVTIYEPSKNLVTQGSWNEAKDRYLDGYFSFPLDSEVREYKNERVEGAPTTMLDLRRDSSDAPIERVRTWISHATYLPVKFEVTFKAAVVTIVMSGARVNESVESSLFALRVPSTTSKRGISPSQP